MNPLDIWTSGQISIAYGQSTSSWAASTINTWLGVIIAVIYLGVATTILKEKQKDMSDKIRQVAILTVGVIVVASVVMMFINNRYGGVTGRVGNVVN